MATKERPPVTVANCYSPTGPYPKYAQGLRDSCKALKVPCISIEVSDQGSWVRNCAVKGVFMQQTMRIMARPLLWIDADATLMQRPAIFRDCGADFGVYAFDGPRKRNACGRVVNLPEEFPDPPKWFNSGTIYFNNTKGGIDMLARWSELCRKDDGEWDQWLLQQAWCDVRPVTLWLPQSYCAIRGRCGEARSRSGQTSRSKPAKPVVWHRLASTEKRVDRS